MAENGFTFDPTKGAPECDHCGESLYGETWYRPAWTLVWLCYRCNSKDLKKYESTYEEFKAGRAPGQEPDEA